MMPEVILVLSSSMFLYTLQQGKGQWDEVATAPGHGLLDKLQQAWGGDRQAQSVPGTRCVPHWQHRGDRKG